MKRVAARKQPLTRVVVTDSTTFLNLFHLSPRSDFQFVPQGLLLLSSKVFGARRPTRFLSFAVSKPAAWTLSTCKSNIRSYILRGFVVPCIYSSCIRDDIPSRYRQANGIIEIFWASFSQYRSSWEESSLCLARID